MNLERPSDDSNIMEQISSDYPAPTQKRSRRKGKKTGLFIAIALIVGASLGIVLGTTLKTWLYGSDVPIQTLSPVVQTFTPIIQGAAELPDAGSTSSFSTSDRFWRRQLTPEYQAIYDALRDCVAGYAQSVTFNIDDADITADVYIDVVRDHPEYFWVNETAVYYSTDHGDYYEIEFTPEYLYSVSQAREYSQYIESVIAQPISELSQLDDYGKVKGVYEFLINNSEYDLDYGETTIYELFADHKGVCEQYAHAAQYMLNRLGLEAIYVTGDSVDDAGSEGHAWNMVEADGDYYNLDLTWGDPVSDDGEQSLSYAYLCVTDADLALSHYRDERSYPRCSATRDNYYVREGRLLSSYDQTLLSQWLDDAGHGDGTLEFRCADAWLYREVKSRFIDNEEIFDLLYNTSADGANGYAYYYDDDMFILEIELEL